MSWYKNTSTWSVFIAACALALSQLPPIAEWFSKPRLDITHGDRIGINSAIGIIGLTLSIELDNKGKIPLDISNLELLLETPSGLKKTLKADSYSRASAIGGLQANYPITTINIPASDLWAETVGFNRDISPTEEEALNDLRLKISQSIFDKQLNRPPTSQVTYYTADSPIVEPAKDFFDLNFDLEKGTYKVQISAYTKQRDEPFVSISEFTIYEYHIQTIKSQVDDYKYGAGIYFPSYNTKQAAVKIRPKI